MYEDIPINSEFHGLHFIQPWEFLLKDAAWVSNHHLLQKGIEQYNYKTDNNIWIFVLASIGALIITLLTVSFQSIKAALADPVKKFKIGVITEAT